MTANHQASTGITSTDSQAQKPQKHDNRAVSAADFDRFDLTAPVESRLPNGGGYVVAGIYDVKPQKFGLIDNDITFAKNFGHKHPERPPLPLQT